MITDFAQQMLVNLARMWFPDEAVGYLVRLGGDDFNRVHCIPNMSSSPATTFSMRTSDLYDAMIRYGFNDVILWHSHPRTRPLPSRDDMVMMTQIKSRHLAIVGLHPFPIICLYEMQRERLVQVVKYRRETDG